MPTIKHPKTININAIKYLREYVQSEGFKKRVQNIQDLQQRNDYYKSAINHINQNINIINTDRSILNQLKYAGANILNALTFNQLYDRNHLQKIDNSVNTTSYDPRTQTIYFDTSQDYSDRIPGSILAHEYGHLINPSNDMINYRNPSTNAPLEYQKIIYDKENSIKHNHHDEVYDEKNSDLLATRWNLFSSKIFDSRNTNAFTKEHYKRYKEYLSKNNFRDRLLEQLSEDNFIKAINEIAYNSLQSNNQDLFYAGKGLKLIPKKKFIE